MPTGIYTRTEKHREALRGRSWSLSDDKKYPGKRRNTGITHFKKGVASWNKGITNWMTKEHKQKLGFKKGFQPWNKGLYGINAGEKNPNWKGGVHTANNALRRTQRYKHWRTAVFERDNYTCQFCNANGVYLEADHIKPFAFFPDLRFELSNGRTLCKDCHMKTPTYKNHKLMEA